MNGMLETIIIFLLTVAMIAFPYSLAALFSTYPGKFWIKRMYQNPILDDDILFFYYQRATEYRMLSMVHIFFKNVIKILGTAALFITVYYAVVNDKKYNLVLLFSLIAAMCQVTELLVPMDKFIQIYTHAARIMEYALLPESARIKNIYKNKKAECVKPQKRYKKLQKTYKKLQKAYESAEEYIGKEYI